MDLRVLHVAPSVAAVDGGPSEVVLRLLPESARLHDVRLVVTDKGLGRDERAALPDAWCIVRGRSPKRWSFAPGIVVPLVRSIRWADVVHVHSYFTYPTTLALWISWLAGKPVVLQPHGGFNGYHLHKSRRLKRFYSAAFDGLSRRSVEAVVGSSTLEASDAREFWSGRTTAFPLIPLGVDGRLADLTSRPSVARVPGQILFLGRVAPKKRLDIVLNALSDPSMQSRSWHLVVAGPIESGLSYDPRRLAIELGIGHRVSFLGPVGRDHRNDLYASSEYFVLPSEDESFGMAAAEAMVGGCVVVASEHVGAAVDAPPGTCFIHRLDSDAMVSALVRSFERSRDSALLSPVQKGTYSWSTTARACDELYRTVRA